MLQATARPSPPARPSTFAGTASDAEDDDLAANLVWTSDIDGPIGSGSSVSAVLSDGVHTITATATDSAGASGSDTVSITVGTPPAPGTMHVGDLIGASAWVRTKWHAIVTIEVHDAGHELVANATVSGVWSNGATGSAECTTDTSGKYSIVKTNLKANVSSVIFSVTGITRAGHTYDETLNHQTVINIPKPL